MRKKFLAVLSAVVIATVAFTGCSSSDSNDATDAATEASEEAEAMSGTIDVVSREDGSGTRSAFVELMGVVDADENDITVDTAEITNSTSVMLQTVAQDAQAIGYVSLGSLSDDVKAIQVDGVDATANNVKNGTYTVSRPFNICYKDGELTDLDQDFINYIFSNEGQTIVDEEGYISIESSGAYEDSGAEGSTITLAGSTSVAPLMNKLADAYKELHPDVSIEIQESGSSAGIQSATEGAVEIGMSSRELTDDESAELVSEQIAMDGIAVIVNNANSIDGLTSEQIQQIYTGEITDWSDVQ